MSHMLHVVLLQLLAYYTVVAQGTDAGKLRDLAKSVNVELMAPSRSVLTVA